MPRIPELGQSVTFLSGYSWTSAFETRGYDAIALEIATFGVEFAASTTCFEIHVCQTAAGTYRPLFVNGANSAASGIVPWETRGVSGNVFAVCDLSGMADYCKVHAQTDCTDSITITVWKYRYNSL